MRLIDADALMKAAGKLWSEMPDGEELSKELMKEINHAPTVGGWISVKYKTPKEDGMYLVFKPNKVFGGFYDIEPWDEDRGMFWSIIYMQEVTGITHWMPLPKQPEEVQYETD